MPCINGKWIKSTSGKTLKSFSPSTGALIGIVEAGNAMDVDKAVDSAEKAFPAWKATPPPERGKILQKVAEILKERKKELGKLVSMEMGKQLKEGLSDVQEAIDIYEYMAGEGRRFFGNRLRNC